MSDRYDVRAREVSGDFLPLPEWLSRRLLRRDEVVTWVRGPRSNPPVERYITHPLLFVFALLVGAVGIVLGRAVFGVWMHPFTFGAAAVLFFGSVFVLAISNAHFTRLVVTNERLLILQGYEICRSWDIDDLPHSLIRYGRRGTGEPDRTVDLDALKTAFGSSSGHFADAKTILAFGKQLGQIKARENDGPRPPEGR